MQRLFLTLALLTVGCAQLPQTTAPSANTGDPMFARLAEEYLAGYLAWRPQAGTGLGWHEYDGKLTDYSRASLDAELARLKSFDRRLAELDTKRLERQALHDYRILRGAIQREIFGFEAMESYTQNPMTYAGALDVNIYIKRNFAPLEDRVRSAVAILNQAPKVMNAARANLAATLPKPQVETAIEMAAGAADFLGQDLAEAVQTVKDEKLLAEFSAANHRAIGELRGYAAYLKEQKLPAAHARYALGREKYAKMLRYGEMISLSPERLLEIGLRELRREQTVFAGTARQIDPNRKPMDVFKVTVLIKTHAAVLAMSICDVTLSLLPVSVPAKVASPE